MYESFILKTPGHGGQNLEAYHWPAKDPACVICQIHGIGEHAGRYDRMNGFFHNAKIAALSMDLPGHGKSFGKRGHCAPRKEVLQDVDQLIKYGKERYPKAKLILYGHSMGGNIVLDYRKRGSCNDVPVAYIISAPWVELANPVPKPLYFVVKILSSITPSFAISSNVQEEDLGHAESVGEYKTHPLVHNKISALCAAEGFDIGKALAEGSLEDNGGAKGKPMLLMHGTKDKVCSISGSEKVAELEDCTFIAWEGLYHEIHNGSKDSKGDEVIEKMVRWVQAL